MITSRAGRWLVTLAILVAVAVSVGGGSTFVALEITTDPKFCTSCHIMQPYYDSWASSSHKNVSCVECHYEPGLLETFEGKFKALSQLAKYVTATQGSKPWAEVSDHSCMRSGCHNSRLLEGEIAFGRIRFDHRHHLVGLRRGKKLRCTSCHSQIVQGDHLTVTTSSCFLCHFKEVPGEEGRAIDDCAVCHGPPRDAIPLGDFVFEHEDYLARGVQCDSCHGDVVRGVGNVPRERCGSCHNKQEHLERIGDVEFMHRNHVTDHSVTCLDCHMEIEHGLPSRAEHFAGACTDCHQGSHAVSRGVYEGQGGTGISGQPSVMSLARVTCTGCHRPPFPDAPLPPAGATFAADPLACIDCHGPGYEGMTESWQAETQGSLEALQAALKDLHGRLQEGPDGTAGGDPAAARERYDAAAANLGLVLLDGSRGVHNLPYVRTLLEQAAQDVRAGYVALGSGPSAPSIPVGPAVTSPRGCTDLCHVGVEQVTVPLAGGASFPHEPHLLFVGLDCGDCHAADPHEPSARVSADCMSCHHGSEDADTCARCHTAVADLRAAVPSTRDPSPMADFDCLGCHSGLADGFSPQAMRETCDFCHADFEPDFAAQRYQPWMEEAAVPLRQLEQRLEGREGEAAARVRAEVRALLEAGPFHNSAWVEEEAERLGGELDGTGG